MCNLAQKNKETYSSMPTHAIEAERATIYASGGVRDEGNRQLPTGAQDNT